jgi:hypothetical protein
MVYAANGAFVVDGIAYGASFRHPERRPEADAHEKWYRTSGWTFAEPEHINEGEGDFTYLPGRELILAGWGFRTDARAHAEAADVFGRPVVSLRLVDPRYYHLDTALAPLDDERIAYYPEAFAPGSRLLLERLFGRIRPQLRLRRPQRRHQRRSPRLRPQAPRRRVRARPGRPLGTQEGRRLRQVLHRRTAPVIDRKQTSL